MKLKIRKRQIAFIILATALLALNFAMRNNVWRRMQHFNQEKTRYEKLALAYKLGGQSGIDYEFKIMTKYEPSAAGFVSQTTAQLKNTKDVGLFLRAAMKKDRDNIKHLRETRNIISAAIFIIISGQVMLNIACWFKSNENDVRAFLQKVAVKADKD